MAPARAHVLSSATLLLVALCGGRVLARPFPVNAIVSAQRIEVHIAARFGQEPASAKQASRSLLDQNADAGSDEMMAPDLDASAYMGWLDAVAVEHPQVQVEASHADCGKAAGVADVRADTRPPAMDVVSAARPGIVALASNTRAAAAGSRFDWVPNLMPAALPRASRKSPPKASISAAYVKHDLPPTIVDGRVVSHSRQTTDVNLTGSESEVLAAIAGSGHSRAAELMSELLSKTRNSATRRGSAEKVFRVYFHPRLSRGLGEDGQEVITKTEEYAVITVKYMKPLLPQLPWWQIW